MHTDAGTHAYVLYSPAKPITIIPSSGKIIVSNTSPTAASRLPDLQAGSQAGHASWPDMVSMQLSAALLCAGRH